MFSYLFIYTLKNNGFTGNSVKIFLFFFYKDITFLQWIIFLFLVFYSYKISFKNKNNIIKWISFVNSNVNNYSQK